MSCPEVVYQAYYPYLYQRPSTSSARPPPPPFAPFAHHPHYDRVSTNLSKTVVYTAMHCFAHPDNEVCHDKAGSLTLLLKACAGV
jgi:hypothetical protein